MSRPLRIEFEGALYHVTSRGDRRQLIFEDDEDRTGFLSLLGQVAADFNWVVHAYCLMGNHYHLLVETPDANLSVEWPRGHHFAAAVNRTMLSRPLAEARMVEPRCCQ
jgi:REP element-mobilizing transposase RayT